MEHKTALTSFSALNFWSDLRDINSTNSLFCAGTLLFVFQVLLDLILNKMGRKEKVFKLLN